LTKIQTLEDEATKAQQEIEEERTEKLAAIQVLINRLSYDDIFS